MPASSQLFSFRYFSVLAEMADYFKKYREKNPRVYIRYWTRDNSKLSDDRLYGSVLRCELPYFRKWQEETQSGCKSAEELQLMSESFLGPVALMADMIYYI